MCRAWHRVAAIALLAAGFALVPRSPADAHTRTQETTNIVSRVVIPPGIDGVELTVHTGGLLVEVENRGPSTLVVHGYEGEPYLRVGPGGVEGNRRSPAFYLNRDRYGDVAMPPDVDATAPPEWIHLEDDPRYLWHDHRTHWMSTAPPAFVAAGPMTRTLMTMRLVGPIGAAGDAAGTFQQWSIPLSVGSRRVDVQGEMAWQDPPRALPWLSLAALLLVPAVAGLRRTDVRGIVRPAALVVGAVAAVNSIHLVDDLVAWPGDPLDEMVGVLHTTIFLMAGIGGAVWAHVVATGRVLALGIASAAVLYHQGIIHLPLLFASQFPTIWPVGLVRLTVALGLLQAVAVAAVCVRARRVALLPLVSEETL